MSNWKRVAKSKYQHTNCEAFTLIKSCSDHALLFHKTTHIRTIEARHVKYALECANTYLAAGTSAIHLAPMAGQAACGQRIQGGREAMDVWRDTSALCALALA